MANFISPNIAVTIKNTLHDELGIDKSFLDSFYEYIKLVYNETNKNNEKLIERILFCDIPSLNPELSTEKCSIGIDLPVWFCDGQQSRKKLMILAMDPLRYKQENGTSTDLISFNSPFSIHERVKNKYYPSIVQLTENYDVYITDVFKLFYRHKANQNMVSNQDSSFVNLKVHTELLQKEIAIFNPDIILCLGKHPLNGLSKIDSMIKPNATIVAKLMDYNFRNIPTFAIPHASGVAAKWAKIFMVTKNDSTYNSRTYILDALKLIEDHILKNK